MHRVTASDDVQIMDGSLEDPRSAGLVAEVQDYYVQIYGGPDAGPFDPAEFRPTDGCFLLALADARSPAAGAAEAVACIGLRRHGPGVGEIKRMYVRPAVRGRGIARALVAAVEHRARRIGYERLVLETGTVQPEAIGLYTALGYRPVPAFGYYADAPLSRFFGRTLDRPAG